MNNIAWLDREVRGRFSTGRLALLLWLSLAPAACTRARSLGAAGDPDGSVDAKVPTPTTDAVSVPPDAPLDAPVACVESGVVYHVGDVIPRPSNGCPRSCRCLPGGVVGQCTGACPVDGSADGAPPIDLAVIKLSRSTNSAEIDVVVHADGSAERIVIARSGGSAGVGLIYPAGSPEVTTFLADLTAIADLSIVGDPGKFLVESCPKSASFGTTTTVTANGVTSGDLQCLIDPTPAQTALAHDCEVLIGTGAFALNACLATMGQVSAALCCSSTGDVPDTCAIGACGCSPADSHMVTTCVCPGGGCFRANIGCLGPPGAAGVCTVGADDTCTDASAVVALPGTCLDGGRCACYQGFSLSPATGRCR